MPRLICLLILLVAICTVSCRKETVTDESSFYGTWVQDDNMMPPDTLHFFQTNGTNSLMYKLEPGSVLWPAVVKTEYRITGDKLELKENFGASTEFYTIESFQWISRNEEFSIELREITTISSDRRVRFRKIN